jgi:ketosteroid isomerase-like protein
MTPFDDPQGELAWMFLQSTSDGGDLDEGFALLSDDFT